MHDVGKCWWFTCFICIFRACSSFFTLHAAHHTCYRTKGTRGSSLSGNNWIKANSLPQLKSFLLLFLLYCKYHILFELVWDTWYYILTLYLDYTGFKKARAAMCHLFFLRVCSLWRKLFYQEVQCDNRIYYVPVNEIQTLRTMQSLSVWHSQYFTVATSSKENIHIKSPALLASNVTWRQGNIARFLVYSYDITYVCLCLQLVWQFKGI